MRLIDVREGDTLRLDLDTTEWDSNDFDGMQATVRSVVPMDPDDTSDTEPCILVVIEVLVSAEELRRSEPWEH